MAKTERDAKLLRDAQMEWGPMALRFNLGIVDATEDYIYVTSRTNRSAPFIISKFALQYARFPAMLFEEAAGATSVRPGT